MAGVYYLGQQLERQLQAPLVNEDAGDGRGP